jgi:cytochrome c oxidase subunit 2
MPTFQNVLTEEDVLKIVAYIKSLQPEERTQ